jgi:oligosaccharide repeat unit polymerase
VPVNVVLFTLVAVLGVGFAATVRLPPLNAITAFAVPWTLLLIIASLPDLGEPGLIQSTWNMIWLALVGVGFGCILGAMLGAFASRDKQPADYQTEVDIGRVVRWHWLLTFALAGYGSLQLYKARALISGVGGWSAIFSSAGGDFRTAQLNQSALAAQTVLDSSGALIGVAGYLLFLGNASLVTGAILWRTGRPYVALLPLLVSALFTLLTLQRASFVMAVLLFATCVSLFASRESGIGAGVAAARSPRRVKPTLAPTVVVLVFTAVAVLLPLQLRNVGSKNATGLTSLFQYLLGGILGLSARDQLNPNWSPPAADGFVSAGAAPGYGSYTFSGLFRVLHQLGAPVPVGPNGYENYTVAVSGVRYWTNIGTSIYDFRLDFGFFGILVVFFVLAFLATLLQEMQINNRALYVVPMTAYFLVTLVWSFFGSSLLDDVKYLLSALFGCYLIRRFVVVRRTPARAPVDSDATVAASSSPSAPRR